ncbi:DNA repair protein [Saccharomycopsis crataegensis]|uniref:DNA repair protein n=1 Tax=Saccharomycopsis crataegensis TaxID=43959 RepID=A0AAV5QEB7_9ASCO|nr:DNA repair protein [Saccharomycopsis crataegensis]
MASGAAMAATQIDIESTFSQHTSISKRKLARATEAFTQTLSESDIDKSPATAGVIEKIVLQNFMCHDYFELELGPQLNFIIGRNGSGKSAILTSISVGLGCKANETDRGKNLKALIKRGTNSSKITITFANRGDEAFEHDKYGDKIVVERTLRLEGTSGYSLRSESGRLVSNKKMDLDLILEFFDITINNPLAFLSQGAAKTFLAASTDDDKYSFFMKGIQMEQTINEYIHSNAQIQKIGKQIELANSSIQALREDAEKAKETYEKFHKFKNLREHKKIISGKLIWHQIIRGEFDIQALQDKKQELDANIHDLQNKIETYGSNLNQLIQDQATVDEEAIGKKTEYHQLCSEKQGYKQKSRDYENKIGSVQNRIDDLQRDIHSKHREIKQLESKIAVEIKKLNDAENGESLEVRLNELNSSRESQLVEQQELVNAYLELEDSSKSQYNSSNSEVGYRKKEIQELRQNRHIILSSEKDKLAPFGNNMRKLLQDIDREHRRFHSKPIGPIGSLISIKPGYDDYHQLLEGHLKALVDSFVVENFHDSEILKGMMKRRNINSRIITRKFEQFDYSEVYNFITGDLQMKTMLDALEFQNVDAMYSLIDARFIEQVVLCESDDNAANILHNNPSIKAMLSLFDGRSGKKLSVNPATHAFRSDPFYYDFGQYSKIQIGGNNDNIDAQIVKIDISIEEKTLELRQLESQNTSAFRKMKAEMETTKRKLEQMKKKIRMTDNEIHNIQVKLDRNDDSSKLEAYQQEKSNIEEEIIINERSINGSNNELQMMKQEFDEFYQEYESFNANISNAEQHLQKLERKSQKLKQQQMVIKDEIDNTKLTITKRTKISQAIDHNISELSERVDQETPKAERWCSREAANIDLSRESLDDIKYQYEVINQQLSQVNRALGKAEDQIIEEYNSKTMVFKEAREELVKAHQLREKLTKAITNRVHAAKTNRELLCLAANQDFSSSLHQRGFEGKLDFDYVQKKLKMLVGKDGKPPREVTALSGGEKSFTQIALLLAIWKPMRSKIRGLDEFDVFMDTVNRKISMRLMLESLRKEPKSQTIFITPQDIGHVKGIDADDVHIHKLKDPARMNNSTNHD